MTFDAILHNKLENYELILKEKESNEYSLCIESLYFKGFIHKDYSSLEKATESFNLLSSFSYEYETKGINSYLRDNFNYQDFVSNVEILDDKENSLQFKLKTIDNGDAKMQINYTHVCDTTFIKDINFLETNAKTYQLKTFEMFVKKVGLNIEDFKALAVKTVEDKNINSKSSHKAR